MKKKAFSLLETLLTICTIALAGLITIPTLKEYIDQKIHKEQKSTFNFKFDQVLQYMQAKSALKVPYSSTNAFLTEMKKYANISKVCEKTNLNECFPEKIYEKNGVVKYNTKWIRVSDNINAKFSGADLGAVLFSDGTSAIIAYNYTEDTNCIIDNIYDLTLDLTKCLAIVYDINGYNPPNVIGIDVGMKNIEGYVDEDESDYDEEY